MPATNTTYNTPSTVPDASLDKAGEWIEERKRDKCPDHLFSLVATVIYLTLFNFYWLGLHCLRLGVENTCLKDKPISLVTVLQGGHDDVAMTYFPCYATIIYHD